MTRRDLLKTSLSVPAAVAAAETAFSEEAQAQAQTPAGAGAPSGSGGGRERLLLDFGWRFHFGHASDMARDFDFRGNFSKTGNFGAVSTLVFDDSDWKAVDLPHDWAIELPFQNDPALQSKGFYPLGRTYPATSVGWYRRILDLPATDAGKRITIEFDAAYREAMVVFNGFYIGRHIGGYDPFSFDVTDFANPGGSNVLLVRVDATQSDGWFYEGAGIYRHVWLVKANPVHVKKWGAFARSEVRPGEATVKIRTEVENHGKAAQTERVTSTILDPAGKVVGKATTAPQAIAGWGEQAHEQQVVVKAPALWSLEQRNLYKLVTEIEVGGAVADRCETPFGIRTCSFDAQKGFFLNGKPVKLKGTCNHQDHAGVGAALPDAVQYFRVRKLQEMGCNALRTSHNPPTPELLNAADELGMLVFDETRMMSSNPEGLAQLADGNLKYIVQFPKYPVSPQPAAQCFFGDNLPRRLEQNKQKLKGQLFKFDALILAQQKARTDTNFKISEPVAVADRLGNFGRNGALTIAEERIPTFPDFPQSGQETWWMLAKY